MRRLGRDEQLHFCKFSLAPIQMKRLCTYRLELFLFHLFEGTLVLHHASGHERQHWSYVHERLHEHRYNRFASGNISGEISTCWDSEGGGGTRGCTRSHVSSQPHQATSAAHVFAFTERTKASSFRARRSFRATPGKNLRGGSRCVCKN